MSRGLDTLKDWKRQTKDIVYNYSEAEVKVRKATSNDPWGPPSAEMAVIAMMTYNAQAYVDIMSMLWKRLNDHGKNWRHVYKSLVLLEYLAKNGSERVVRQCQDNIFSIQTLKDFQYLDKDGKDQGVNVREKAKSLAALLKDSERLQEERDTARRLKERMTEIRTGSSGPRNGTQHAEQTRGDSSYDEELQRVMALSLAEHEKEKKLREQENKAIEEAMERSKSEVTSEEPTTSSAQLDSLTSSSNAPTNQSLGPLNATNNDSLLLGLETDVTLDPLGFDDLLTLPSTANTEPQGVDNMFLGNMDQPWTSAGLGTNQPIANSNWVQF